MKKNGLLLLGLVLSLVLSAGCRTTPGEEGDDVLEDVGGDGGVTFPDVEPQDLTGNERWVQPAGTAKITFFVDDRANQTFADGDMTWTGSWAWNEEDNTIVFSAAWGPDDGPYPLLYDDGPVSQGGHEMEGAEAGDHIFSTEVYFKAEEETEFSYGVLNELGYWMWEGPNGLVSIPAGSTESYTAQGLTLKPFGDIDLKLTVDVGKVNPSFSFIEEWDAVNVYVKGSMNMWTPLQILDAGPDIDKGDDVAGDGIYTFVQGKNLGKHTGLLLDGQHAQFTFVFGKPEEDIMSASEYKILTEGVQKGAKEGVKAFLSCDGGATWNAAEIVWEKDSWGSTENTTIVARCDGTPPPPDCTTDEECGEGEKCIDGECLVWCDLDEECGEGEKCIDNECKVWCDLDEECPEGYACVGNQCTEIVIVSEPKINSVTPADGPVEGGTLVTLAGADFQDGAKVLFEGAQASAIVVHSDSKIECVTPAGAAGKADVTVTNPDGGTDTYINGFTYVDVAEAPTINGIDPTQGPVTGGTAVHISGSNFLPGPTVFFGQTLAKSVEFVSSSLVIATTPSGPLGKVDVTLVNSDGQEDTLEEAFVYVPNTVDYAKLLQPGIVTTYAGEAGVAIYAEVYEPNLTEPEGVGAGLQAQFGYGLKTADPADWTWADATYDADSGNNDVYTGTLQGAEPGNYGFTFRFSMDGANWVTCDLTGNLDGFDVQDTGKWEVLELGDGPAIFKIAPAGVSVLGGDTVTITGANFDAELVLSVAGEAVDPVNVTATSIVFSAPAHAPGAVDIVVENPDGEKAEVLEGLHYVLKMTPSVDGGLDEWTEAFLLAENTLESNWDPALNRLDALYVAFDKTHLYVAVAGTVEAGNYILGYVDVDMGSGTGHSDMTSLSDNEGGGDLDDALSNVLDVTVDGFGADFAFGTNGMASFAAGSDLGGAKDVGWRQLTPVDNLAWLDGSVIADADGETLEAAIPLATLFPNGVPGSGKTVALFIRLSNGYGGFNGLSNQTLPEFFDGETPQEVGSVVTLEIVP